MKDKPTLQVFFRTLFNRGDEHYNAYAIRVESEKYSLYENNSLVMTFEDLTTAINYFDAEFNVG